ncbi:MAG: chromosome segregation ATPase [Limisphaerales bacterium]|jgi:chromosome segregation ATPase
MVETANVSSLDALQRLRNALVIYVEKAGHTIDEASSDSIRLRHWLQGEKTEHWKREYKQRLKKLEDARGELLSARMSNLTEVSMLHQMAVKRAQRELEEAEQKLRKIKRWLRDYDQRVLPLAKQLEKFRTVIDGDLPKGIAFLDHALNSLDQYARMTAPSISDVSTSATPESDDANTTEGTA